MRFCEGIALEGVAAAAAASVRYVHGTILWYGMMQRPSVLCSGQQKLRLFQRLMLPPASLILWGSEGQLVRRDSHRTAAGPLYQLARAAMTA